ncbi:hypothetical protein ES703_05861 [subsurface metagenome]
MEIFEPLIGGYIGNIILLGIVFAQISVVAMFYGREYDRNYAGMAKSKNVRKGLIKPFHYLILLVILIFISVLMGIFFLFIKDLDIISPNHWYFWLCILYKSSIGVSSILVPIYIFSEIIHTTKNMKD